MDYSKRMCQGCFIDQKRKLGDRRRSDTISTGAGGSPPAVCRSVAHLVGGPCACVVGDLALARVPCVSAAWAWGWLLVCVLGDLALGRVRCVWAALACFAVLRFGFDMCPPIPRILPSSNPQPPTSAPRSSLCHLRLLHPASSLCHLLRHELRSATSTCFTPLFHSAASAF